MRWPRYAPGEGSLLDPKRLDAVDESLLAKLTEHLFPNVGATGAKIAGIRWLDPALVDGSGVLDVPAATRMQARLWGERGQGAARGWGRARRRREPDAAHGDAVPRSGLRPVAVRAERGDVLMSGGPLALARLPAGWRLGARLAAKDESPRWTR